ncbi:MAG: rRNA maturation RNase YbeY [Maribacter sp.]|nr:rRNA maturation RNase YbeY [Maribacter sp.]
MIEFFYEGDFELNSSKSYSYWISRVIASEKGLLGNLNFIFCDNEYLLALNQKHLNHDTFTDILSFDYSEGQVLSGDIFISTQRVKENARVFNIKFQEELLRVMAHGVLHLLGFNDKTSGEVEVMRRKEEEKIKMFHVEHN